MDEQREYWAFISYRHLDNKDAGREWATWIAREIETYEVPPELVGTKGSRGDTIPERIYPVFRDEDELSADADLSSPIYEALRNSKTVVVICSPRAVSSRYVGSEISYFKSLGHGDRVLAMMIEGEPHAPEKRECFPEALKHSVDKDGKIDPDSQVEPVAADFRLPDGSQGWHSPAEYRKHLPDDRAAGKYRERCNLAKLKLIAGIIGVPLGKLIERDKAYQLALAKRKARIFTAVAAAMAILAVLAVVGGIFAMIKRQEADDERDRAQRSEKMALHARGTAEELIGQMLFDLGGKLDGLGKIELLEDVSVAAENYFENLPPDQIDTESERNRSVMLDSRARILRDAGNLDGALAYYTEGLDVVKKLASESPENLVLENDVILSLQHVADIVSTQNRQEEALRLYEEASVRLQRLTDKRVGLEEARFLLLSLLGEEGEEKMEWARLLFVENPEIGGLMATSAVLMERLGKFAFQRGEFDEAEASFRGAAEIQEALAVVDPDSREIKMSLYSGLNSLGNIEIQRMDPEGASESFEELITLAESELARDPDDAQWREKLANALSRLGVAVSQLGETEHYRDLQLRAMEEYRAVAKNDPGNNVRQRNLMVGLSQAGLSEKSLGNYEAARSYLEQSGEIAAALVEIDPTNALWRQDYAFSLAQQADVLRLSGSPEEALEVRLKEVEQQRIVSEGFPENLLYRRNFIFSLNATGIGYWVLETLDEAVRYLTESENLAASIVDDLPESNSQSLKDLHDVRTFLANIEEQRNRIGKAVEWYEKALATATTASNEGVAWEKLTPLEIILSTQKIEKLRTLSQSEGSPRENQKGEEKQTAPASRKSN